VTRVEALEPPQRHAKISSRCPTGVANSSAMRSYHTGLP
jgi:hypothetical protein